MSSVDVLTNRYDVARSGVNSKESVLSPRTVGTATFGKLFTRKVDGDVYAQPLVVCGVDTPGGSRNVVYVATASNSLYAFDADDANAGGWIWKVDATRLGKPVPATAIVNEADPGLRYHDFQKTIGIISTPVIDRTRDVIYLVAKSALLSAGNITQHVYKLHAIDIRNGNERDSSPATIEASVPGTGIDAANGTVSFTPMHHLNRPGLLLVDNILYIAFGSHGDWNKYHGWVLAYDSRTLRRVATFCNTPDGRDGGIWQSGTGLSSDGRDVYFVSGNGSVGNGNSSMCIGRLRRHNDKLNLAGSFTPGDAQQLSQADQDLSTAPIVVEGRDEVIAGAKTGYVYVVKFDANTAMLEQAFAASQKYTSPYDPSSYESNIHGSPIVWQHGGEVDLFVWGEFSRLNVFRHTAAGYQPLASSSMQVPHGMPGAIMALSSDGDNADSAIIWASQPYTEIANPTNEADANKGTVSGILRAFSANAVSLELWNSELHSTRDRVGLFAKFCPPTVANGKVYLATFSDPKSTAPNELVVYGLIGSGAPRATPMWIKADIGTPLVSKYSLAHGRLTVTAAGDDIEQWADSFAYVFQQRSGDITVVARVRSLDNRDPWVKAGVMVRDSVDPSSVHASVFITARYGSAFQRRVAFHGEFRHNPGPLVYAAYWIRMKRHRNEFTASISSDGNVWNDIGTDTIPVRSDALVGLAVSSHTNGVYETHPFVTATFDNIRITQP